MSKDSSRLKTTKSMHLRSVKPARNEGGTKRRPGHGGHRITDLFLKDYFLVIYFKLVKIIFFKLGRIPLQSRRALQEDITLSNERCFTTHRAQKIFVGCVDALRAPRWFSQARLHFRLRLSCNLAVIATRLERKPAFVQSVHFREGKQCKCRPARMKSPR